MAWHAPHGIHLESDRLPYAICACDQLIQILYFICWQDDDKLRIILLLINIRHRKNTHRIVCTHMIPFIYNRLISKLCIRRTHRSCWARWINERRDYSQIPAISKPRSIVSFLSCQTPHTHTAHEPKNKTIKSTTHFYSISSFFQPLEMWVCVCVFFLLCCAWYFWQLYTIYIRRWCSHTGEWFAFFSFVSFADDSKPCSLTHRAVMIFRVWEAWMITL